MQFPQRFSALPEYAFPRLRRLLQGHAPGGNPVRVALVGLEAIRTVLGRAQRTREEVG